MWIERDNTMLTENDYCVKRILPYLDNYDNKYCGLTSKRINVNGLYVRILSKVCNRQRKYSIDKKILGKMRYDYTSGDLCGLK
jgi:hypothetical protein